MPQSGPRKSPLTERLQAIPREARTAAIVDPGGVKISWPFTVMRVCSGMTVFDKSASRQKRRERNSGLIAQHLICEQLRCAQSCRYAETFVSGGEVKGRIGRRFSDNGQLVGSRGTEPGPGADGRRLGQGGHELEGAPQHARENFSVNLLVLNTILARRTDQHLTGLTRLNIESH